MTTLTNEYLDELIKENFLKILKIGIKMIFIFYYHY